jgi:hypothetical protein
MSCSSIFDCDACRVVCAGMCVKVLVGDILVRYSTVAYVNELKGTLQRATLGVREMTKVKEVGDRLRDHRGRRCSTHLLY